MNSNTFSPQQIAQTVATNVAKVIIGKDEVVELLLVALFCESHVLLEDVPGIGKTTLAKTLARSLSGTFQRIQFTPDLLPSDITGVSIFNQQRQEFEYRHGPVMTQILLADEINRAGPRTQSALLEAMEERQVTVDGVTRPLPYPFLVLATQNPVEQEGVFPLPEAQLDRFLMRINLGYPSRDEERQILRRFRIGNPLSETTAVVSLDQVRLVVQACRQVFVHPSLEDYLLDIISATRKHASIVLGASPRASLALHRASQALAAIRGRNYVLPDDIKRLALPILTHRLAPSIDARLHEQAMRSVLTSILEQVATPVEEVWEEK